MQVAPLEMEFAELPPDVADDLGGFLAGGQHRFEQQQTVEDPVAFWDVASHADAAGFLAADQKIVRRVEHDLADVFEADRSLEEPEAVAFGDAPHDDRLRESTGHRAFPALPPDQVQQQDHQDLMGVDVFSALVHRAYAVGVAVGYQSHQRAAFADHARGQFQTPRHRFGQHTAEERIAISANGFNADFAAGEHRFDPTPARPMHRIGDDQRAGVPQVIDLYQALYVAAVIAIRSMRRIRINDVGQPLFLRF